MTLTPLRERVADCFDDDFENELTREIRLAELVIAMSGCSAQRAFRLVQRRGDETPFERLALALAATLRKRSA